MIARPTGGHEGKTSFMHGEGRGCRIHGCGHGA